MPTVCDTPDQQPTMQSITKRQRICFLLPSFWQPVMGGAQYQAMVLAKRMIELDRFDLHYLARRMPDNHKEPGLSLHKIGRSRNMYFLFDAPGIRRVLTRLDPDVVYAHVGCAYVGIAARHCAASKAKLIWHIASDIDLKPWTPTQRRNLPMSFIDKKFMEYGLRHADHIVVQSQLQAELLQTNYQRTASALVKNFHPPVTEPIDKGEEPIVLWVANLKEVKQPGVFVELARGFLNHPAHFYLLGGMQLDETRERALVASIDQLPNCSYLGPVSQEEVNRWLANGHLLVNTSSYEGFSNTFIQAWQRHVPVCALNVDPDGLLSEKGLGSFAEGNASRLAEQIEEFLANPQKRINCGNAAAAYAAEHHSIRAADRLIELFE